MHIDVKNLHQEGEMLVIFTACSHEPDIAGRVKWAKDETPPCSYPLMCIDLKYDQPQNEVFAPSIIHVYRLCAQ